MQNLKKWVSFLLCNLLFISTFTSSVSAVTYHIGTTGTDTLNDKYVSAFNNLPISINDGDSFIFYKDDVVNPTFFISKSHTFKSANSNPITLTATNQKIFDILSAPLVSFENVKFSSTTSSIDSGGVINSNFSMLMFKIGLEC